MEPASNGRTYGHSAAILINLVSALELALLDGKHRHTRLRKSARRPGIQPPLPPSGTSGRHSKSKSLAHRSGDYPEQPIRETHQDFYPTPILSAFFEGPMDMGKDLIQGGATINSSGATIIGLADVVDSLSAIQEWVFKKPSISFAELLEALREDFQTGDRFVNYWRIPTRRRSTAMMPQGRCHCTEVVRMLDDAFRVKRELSRRKLSCRLLDHDDPCRLR